MRLTCIVEHRTGFVPHRRHVREPPGSLGGDVTPSECGLELDCAQQKAACDNERAPSKRATAGPVERRGGLVSEVGWNSSLQLR
jgi:hypothetical protein